MILLKILFNRPRVFSLLLTFIFLAVFFLLALFQDKKIQSLLSDGQQYKASILEHRQHELKRKF